MREPPPSPIASAALSTRLSSTCCRRAPGNRTGGERGLDVERDLDVPQGLLRREQRDDLGRDLGHRARSVGRRRGRILARAGELEQVAHDDVHALGLPLHPLDEVVALLVEAREQEHLFEPEQRRERVADLVRQTRGQAPHRGQALAAHDGVAGGQQIGARGLELAHLGGEASLALDQEPGGGGDRAPGSTTSLAPPRAGIEQPQARVRVVGVGVAARPALRDARGRDGERADRPNDQAREQRVREREQDDREARGVERQQAQQRGRARGLVADPERDLHDPALAGHLRRDVGAESRRVSPQRVLAGLGCVGAQRAERGLVADLERRPRRARYPDRHDAFPSRSVERRHRDVPQARVRAADVVAESARHRAPEGGPSSRRRRGSARGSPA